MEETVVAKFVSKKISRVRWRPTSKHIVQPPSVCAAGSWDDEVAGSWFVVMSDITCL